MNAVEPILFNLFAVATFRLSFFPFQKDDPAANACDL